MVDLFRTVWRRNIGTVVEPRNVKAEDDKTIISYIHTWYSYAHGSYHMHMHTVCVYVCHIWTVDVCIGVAINNLYISYVCLSFKIEFKYNHKWIYHSVCSGVLNQSWVLQRSRDVRWKETDFCGCSVPRAPWAPGHRHSQSRLAESWASHHLERPLSNFL